MRLRWGTLFLSTFLIGCAHKGAPPPKNPEASPAPKGDLLRFKAAAGEEPKAAVTLLIEQEVTPKNGEKGGPRKVVLNFTISEEEKVDAIAPDGTAQISSRLVDVSGKAGQGATQEQVDDFALALDELKIQFRRSPRGDVSSITMTGVRTPLDDRAARTILNSIFAGGRGPILPEASVDVGATWNNTTSVPTPFSTSAEVSYSYKYVAKDNGVATLSCDGALDSQKGAGSPSTKRMVGKNTSEYKFNIGTGKLVTISSDATTQLEDSQGGGSSKQHVKVIWSANQ